MENADKLGRDNGIKFNAEPLMDCLQEVKRLHLLQWEELKMSARGLEFNPDYDKFLESNLEGKYVVFTARQNGMLVGNSAFWLFPSTYTQKVTAQEDNIYLLPEFRKGLVGIKFFKYCEEVLKSIGVSEINFSFSENSDQRMKKIWERMGYTMKYIQMSKVLVGG